MPVSELHEVLVHFFLSRPALAAELLADPLGLALPPFSRVSLSSAELTTLAPTEYRADAVLTLDDDAGRPIRGVVLEVQLSDDQHKWRTWPAYVANSYARLGCPVVLLVVCPDPATARWAATPIRFGEPDLVLTPVVLGPKRIPVVTDPAVARQKPELAVLSVVAHGGRADPEPILKAFLAGLSEVDHEHADLYANLVWSLLPQAARKLLKEFAMENVVIPREFDYFTRAYQKGVAEGEAKGEAEALLEVLGARGVTVPDADRERIAACTDIDRLKTWLHRAATATTIRDLDD